MEEVGRGSDVRGDGGDRRNTVTFAWDDRRVGAWIVPSVVWAIEEFFNNLGGSNDVDLVNVVKLGLGGDGEGGGSNNRGGERRRH